jgi:hypothetical protein
MRLLHRFPALNTRSVRVAEEDATMFRRVERFEAIGNPIRFRLVVNSVLSTASG